VLKKLFGGQKVPPNNGDTEHPMELGGVHWVKEYEVELSNMENSPRYPLTHQLSVGSEIGNIIIADPSISPRHCTFILQQEVVSVLDHGSLSGTFVSGTKIPPGKYIILEDTDVVVAGELEIRLITKTVSAPAEHFPPADLPQPTRKIVMDEFLKDQDTDGSLHLDEAPPLAVPEKTSTKQDVAQLLSRNVDATAPIPGHVSGVQSMREVTPFEGTTSNIKVAPLQDGKKIKKVQNKKNPGSRESSEFATNSIIRVIAVIFDALLAYSIYVIFSPFDEFRKILHLIPESIAEALGIEWQSLWQTLTADFGFLGAMAEDISDVVTKTHLVPMFITFILVRAFSTLLLGVSLSESLLGVMATGNAIWNRVGGVIRVLVGAVTGPFLVFDIPSIISRRTLKEFLTFTHTFSSSNLFAIFGTIVGFPLLLGLALFAPLLQGLEAPTPIAVSDKIEQRVKITDTQTEATPQVITSDSSQFYGFNLNYSPSEVSLIPLFKFRGAKAKTQYQNQLAFYHKDIQRTVNLEVYKKFDLKQLLAIGMRGNFFLFDKYPQMHDYVYSLTEVHPNLKTPADEKDNANFVNEFMNFTKLSFDLNLGNALDVMQTETPILKGFIEYRAALMALLEYKDFDQISFIRLGNVTFMKISYQMQKPFDFIIPILKGEGRIYKVEYDKKETVATLANKFYKYTLFESTWFSGKTGHTGETMSAMQVIDLFSTLDFKKKEIAPDKAQSLYGYYYEKSAQVLTEMNSLEYANWKESVSDAFKIMNALSSGPKDETQTLPEGSEDPRQKLLQNFKDLKDAVEGMDKTYFGLEQNPSV
jgi:hypothetical protein